MNRPIITLLALCALVAVAALATWTPAGARAQQMPPDHPPIGMPPGHPPLPGQMPAGHPPIDGSFPAHLPAAPADPADVTTIEQIVDAYYDSVSGGRGEARDWDRFRSLFIPEARLIAAHPGEVPGAGPPCIVLSPEQFVQMNSVYFERGGYFEHDIHRRIERFGNAAHVFSTYESRRSIDDAAPYSRGINSLQLVYDGERWWIAGVMWDFERPDNPIPAEHLPAEEGL